MAHSIPEELTRELKEAVLTSCPPEQIEAAEALCVLLEQGDIPLPQDPAAVEAELHARLEQDPTDLEALCALDRLHGNPDDLIEVLRSRCDLAVDVDERWMLLVRLGLLHLATGSAEGVQSIVDLLQPRPAAGAN